MVDTAVVDDKYTFRGRIWIHYLKEAFEPILKLITIVAANLDMAVDDPFSRYSRQNQVST